MVAVRDAGVQLRLRRWDAKRGVPEAPLDLEARDLDLEADFEAAPPTEAPTEPTALPAPQGARGEGSGAAPLASTLGSLGLGRKTTLLLEARPKADAWPPPSPDDLYVRARLWTQPEEARRRAGERVHAGRAPGEEWEAECDEGSSLSPGRRPAAAASAAGVVAPAEEGKDVLDRRAPLPVCKHKHTLGSYTPTS